MPEPARYECRSRPRRPLLRKSSSECAQRAVSTPHPPHAISRAELTLAIETWFVMRDWGYGEGGSIKTRGRSGVNTKKLESSLFKYVVAGFSPRSGRREA